MFEHLRRYFDPDIKRGDVQSDLKNRKKLSAFWTSHVKARHYFFCVKKCGEESCDVCFPRRLPEVELHFLPDPMPSEDNDHYLPFDVSMLFNFFCESSVYFVH